VGTGNVAWHMSQDMEKAGHFVPVVYSRDREKAGVLAAQLYDTEVAESLDFLFYQLDVLILSVPDDVIQMVAEMLVVGEETVVVHCSGAKPIEALNSLGDNFGVFYPLQSFTKEKALDLGQAPICIESTNAHVHNVLFSLGKSISSKVVVMDSDSRKVLHLAAVFANNFVNHMLFLARNIMDSEDLDFNLLKPLVQETVEKAFFLTPELAQTGPARRGDQLSMQAHLDLLSDNPEWVKLYKMLSTSIQLNL
jgi:predicted short-subunit dehydrogenase-like oxidoreductase (DUF2520 family)